MSAYLNRQSLQKVEFFEDSFLSESYDLNKSKLPIDELVQSLSAIEALKAQVASGNISYNQLEIYRDRLVTFCKLQESIGSQRIEDSLQGQGFSDRLRQSVQWCKKYLYSLSSLYKREISFGEFQKYLSRDGSRELRQMVESSGNFQPIMMQTTQIQIYDKKVPMPKRRNPAADVVNSIETDRVIVNNQQSQSIYQSNFVQSPKMPRSDSQNRGIQLTINSKTLLKGSSRNTIQSPSQSNIPQPILQSKFASQYNIPPPAVHIIPSNVPLVPPLPLQTTQQMVQYIVRPHVVESVRLVTPPQHINIQNEIAPYVVYLQEYNLQLSGKHVPIRGNSYKLNIVEEQQLPRASSPQVIPNIAPPSPIPKRHEEFDAEDVSSRYGMSNRIDSPDLVVRRYRPPTHKTYADIDQTPYHFQRSVQENTAGGGFKSVELLKLSDFTNEKRKRRLLAERGPIQHPPYWIVMPFRSAFYNNELYNRWRKSCLRVRNSLYRDENLEIICRVDTESCSRIRLRITFKNHNPYAIQLKCVYNLSKAFRVTEGDDIRSKLTIDQEAQHTFCLDTVYFPLGVCSLQIRQHGLKAYALLPVSLSRYMQWHHINREDWLDQWNYMSKYRNRNINRRLYYDKKILSVDEMTFLFPETMQLGRKNGYSFDEFGGLCSFSYYKLRFLVLFAFNVDSLITIEVMSLSEMDQYMLEFLEYYLDVLMMLIERLDNYDYY